MIPLPGVPFIIKQYTLDKCKILQLPLCLLDTGSEANFLNATVLTPDFQCSKKQTKTNLTNPFNSAIGKIREEIRVNVRFPDSAIEVPNCVFNIINELCMYHVILLNNYFYPEKLLFLWKLFKKFLLTCDTCFLQKIDQFKHRSKNKTSTLLQQKCVRK